jgi:gliding motility-associated-like protein
VIAITNIDSIQIISSLSQYNGNNISCNGYNDGSINTSITGPAPINLITWTNINGNLISPLNINNDTSLIDLFAGIYIITVVDINGCTSSDTIELFEPNVLVNNYLTDSVTCYGGNDGIAYANPTGGTSPYQISWSTGSINDTVFGLNGSSMYYVQISDTNNCPMVLDTIQIPQPDILQITNIINIPTCFGLNDGQIIISSVSGGTGPYTYQWNDSLSSTGTILANINSGQYICTITDAIGCIEDVVINVDTVFAVEINVNITSDYNGLPINCYGDTNASALAQSINGTAPYSYFWLSSGINDTLSNIDLLSNVGAGTYIAYTVDANGCQDFYTLDISSPDSISYIFQTSDFNGFNISCDGYNDGYIDLILTGGNGINFNSLIWNTGDTNPLINNLSIGNYSFSVDDLNGCSANGQISLNSPDALYLELSNDSLLCFGDSNGNIIIDSINNAITPFNYFWSNGQTGIEANNLTAGSYSLLLTDDNNCSVTSITSIYEPNILISLLSVNSSYNGSQISCYEANDAFASVNSFGGVTPYTYSVDSVYFSSTSSFNNLSQGFLNIFTKDSNGCLINDSILILHPDQITSNFQIISNPSCEGVNNGEITSLTTGGTGLYYYQWSTNDSLTNIIDSLLPGSYAVEITDDNGCVINDTIILSPSYSLNAVLTSSQVTCTGYSDGTATVDVLNGVTPINYQWNNSMNGDTINGLSAGLYYVFLTDSNGCQFTDSILVTESDSVLSYIATIIEPSCYLDTNGSILVNVSGGLGDYLYSWNTSNGTATIGSSTDTSTSIINLGSNSYILNISDSVGCVITDTFLIDGPIAFSYNLLSNNISCFGNSDGNADIQVIGGTLPYSFSWSNLNNLISNYSFIDSLISGVYSINVFDSNGCNFQDSIIIEEPQLLSSSIQVVDPLCYNSNDGFVLINIIGGTAPYSSDFGLLNQNNIFSDSILYSNLEANTDTLYIYDNNNCLNEYDITINQPSELEIIDFNFSHPSCFNYSNGSASLNATGGTPPYSYQLLDINNNIINSSQNINNLSSGNYLFVVNDYNNCFEDNSFDIINPNEISIIANSINNVDCFGEYSGSLTVDINNNVGSSQIIWSPAEFNTNSNSITNLSAGSYNIVVIDENSCTKVDSFEITQNDQISVSFNTINSTCSSSFDGEIDILIDGGISPYSIYNNSNQITSNVFSSYVLDSLLPTNYNFKISDSYNCEFDTIINLDFNGGYDCINEPVVLSPNFDNYNDLWTPISDLDIEINVVILNRWGQKEYQYKGNSLLFSWNGLANLGGSRELPTSDYYYIIKFNNNDYLDRTGVITLIR